MQGMIRATMIDTGRLYTQLANAFNAREWRTAQEIALRLLPYMPHHGGTHYLAGVAFMELGHTAQALRHLQHATYLEPDRAHYAAQLAKALSIAQRLQEARLAADQALALAPRDPWSFNTLGQVYTVTEAHRQATHAFLNAVTLMPECAPFRFNLANALLAEGRLREAEQEFDACIRHDAKFWPAYSSRASLRGWMPDENHIGTLHALIDENAHDGHAQLHLNMAIAKEYEDLQRYDDAFAHYIMGKRAGGAAKHYSHETDRALFDAIISSLPEAQPASAGFATREPIFVVGMPRTGTTLLERIITSHPDVTAAGELQNFGMAVKRASSSASRMMLDLETVTSLRHIDWRALGESYLQSTRPGTGRAKHFVDKLPHNFIYAGFIANALPDAKIICVRRNPLDTCLSNFRQLFSQQTPYFDYAYDLCDTGRYYVLFDKLMDHWKALFPTRILEVSYESLIDAQQDVTRRILAHCGLDWSEACLQFDQSKEPVATASAAQVRSPIYRSAMHRWKSYAGHLAELRELLESNGISVED